MKHTERRGMWGVPSDFLNTEASNARECVLPLGGGGSSVPDFFCLFPSCSKERTDQAKKKKRTRLGNAKKDSRLVVSVCPTVRQARWRAAACSMAAMYGKYTPIHQSLVGREPDRLTSARERERKVRCDGESRKRQAGLGTGSRNRPSRRASR